VELSFGEFVKYLVLLLQKNDIALPFNKQELWHCLFYRLKQPQEVAGKPAFLEKLWFDWDGPYPKSPELSKYLYALRSIGVVQTNSPRFDRYWLSKSTEELWQEQFEKLDQIIKLYIVLVVEIAREEFDKVVSQA